MKRLAKTNQPSPKAKCWWTSLLIYKIDYIYKNTWGRAASWHLQPVSVVINRVIRSLNTNELVSNIITTICKTQKILQLKDIYNREVNIFMYKYANLSYRIHLSIILNSLQVFIHIIQYKSKPDNLLCQEHVHTQALKW